MTLAEVARGPAWGWARRQGAAECAGRRTGHAGASSGGRRAAVVSWSPRRPWSLARHHRPGGDGGAAPRPMVLRGDARTGWSLFFAAPNVDVLLYPVADLVYRHRFFDQLPARRKVDAVVVVAFPLDDDERRRLDLLGVRIVAAGGQSADYPYVSINDLQTPGARRCTTSSTSGTPASRCSRRSTPTSGPPTGRSRAYESTLDRSRDRGRSVADPHERRGVAKRARCRWAHYSACAIRRRPSTPTPTRSRSARSGPCGGPDCASPRTCRSSGSTTIRLAALADLTTVRQPVLLQGRRAGESCWVSAGQRRNRGQAVTVPTGLVIRASTAPPRRPR